MTQERWAVQEDEDGFVTVYRNGQWYSGADDIEDAVGIIRSIDYKAPIDVTERDGYRGTR